MSRSSEQTCDDREHWGQPLPHGDVLLEKLSLLFLLLLVFPWLGAVSRGHSHTSTSLHLLFLLDFCLWKEQSG